MGLLTPLTCVQVSEHRPYILLHQAKDSANVQTAAEKESIHEAKGEHSAGPGAEEQQVGEGEPLCGSCHIG